MSPRKVIRSKHIRKVIAFSGLAVLLLVAALFIPYGWVAAVVVGVVGLSGLIIFGIPCFILAVVHWVRFGYITNPLRHGPWGDWKGGLPE